MNGDEYARQLQVLGSRLHENGGVVWEEAAPFFWRTAHPLLQLERGAARPRRLSALAGYRHLLPDGSRSEHARQIMWLDESAARAFSIGSLGSSKRARVRKGIRLLEVRPITDLDSCLEEMRHICISAAQRNGAGRPPAYYIERQVEWERFMRRLFELPQRGWLGAFLNKRLLAYYHTFAVDGTEFISAAKSHSDGLSCCPNDALLYTFLRMCAQTGACRGVVFGDAAKDCPSLDRFKGTYGFQRRDIPEYRRVSGIARLLESGFRKRTARHRRTDAEPAGESVGPGKAEPDAEAET